MNILNRAIQLAALYHNGHTRENGEPYIMHPLRVAAALPTRSPDWVKAVAVLHDVIADTPCSAMVLSSEFEGFDVLNTVIELTRNEGEEYMEYINRIREGSPVARQIKILDLKDNMAHHTGESRLARHAVALEVLQAPR